MIWILSSVVTASLIFIIFKIIELQKADNYTSIVVNYCVAAIIGLCIHPGAVRHFFDDPPWFFPAVAIGVFFFFLFYLIAVTTQQSSVISASVANKISMVIPVGAAFMLYNDSLSIMKAAGIAFALPAVYFSSGTYGKGPSGRKFFFMPVLLFICSGLLDTLMKYTEHTFLMKKDILDFSAAVFTVAFFTGALFTAFTGKLHITRKNLVWGIVLGVPNYFSIYFLLLALKSRESSVVFPLNNVGIVTLSVLLSVMLFKEEFRLSKCIGLACALLSILLVYHG